MKLVRTGISLSLMAIGGLGCNWSPIVTHPDFGSFQCLSPGGGNVEGNLVGLHPLIEEAQSLQERRRQVRLDPAAAHVTLPPVPFQPRRRSRPSSLSDS